MSEFQVDEKGFAKLLQLNFLEYRGLVLLDNNLNEKQIDSLLESHSNEEVQRLKNHQEMYFYASFDIDQQREFGKRLKECWEKKLPVDCPNIDSIVEIKDDDTAVVLTVLNK